MKKAFFLTVFILIVLSVASFAQSNAKPKVPPKSSFIPSQATKDEQAKNDALYERGRQMAQERERQGLPPYTIDEAFKMAQKISDDYDKELRLKNEQTKNQSLPVNSTGSREIRGLSISTDPVPVKRVDEPVYIAPIRPSRSTKYTPSSGTLTSSPAY